MLPVLGTASVWPLHSSSTSPLSRSWDLKNQSIITGLLLTDLLNNICYIMYHQRQQSRRCSRVALMCSTCVSFLEYLNPASVQDLCSLFCCLDLQFHRFPSAWFSWIKEFVLWATSAAYRLGPHATVVEMRINTPPVRVVFGCWPVRAVPCPGLFWTEISDVRGMCWSHSAESSHHHCCLHFPHLLRLLLQPLVSSVPTSRCCCSLGLLQLSLLPSSAPRWHHCVWLINRHFIRKDLEVCSFSATFEGHPGDPGTSSPYSGQMFLHTMPTTRLWSSMYNLPACILHKNMCSSGEEQHLNSSLFLLVMRFPSGFSCWSTSPGTR